MSTKTKTGESQYQVMPVAAFRRGQELEVAQLPVRVVTRPWRILAWLFFGFCVFLWFGVVVIHLEETYSSTASANDLKRFPAFLLFVGGVFLASAVYFWRRVDEVTFRRAAVRITRRSLFGTDTRQAAISDYRGIRAMLSYVGDGEDSSGVTHWNVVLTHQDAALDVLLFAKMRREPSDDTTSPPPNDRTDWTAQMNLVAKHWSRDLGLPLLPPSEDVRTL